MYPQKKWNKNQQLLNSWPNKTFREFMLEEIQYWACSWKWLRNRESVEITMVLHWSAYKENRVYPPSSKNAVSLLSTFVLRSQAKSLWLGSWSLVYLPSSQLQMQGSRPLMLHKSKLYDNCCIRAKYTGSWRSFIKLSTSHYTKEYWNVMSYANILLQTTQNGRFDSKEW